ncbi:probable acyl carrier protein, mitochondrial [Coccomyxa sp. Obi]|nr:acyl carrier protein [Coccomyxa sp. Obi]BDA40973.1 probable acyl carrier protein, mitochondrial [Coccomyxa sp. Obi]
MALLGALQSLRSSLLTRVSIPVNRVQVVGAASTLSLVRAFSESTYLDKNVVTDRVLNVVKNFDKVDPSKVTPTASFQKDLGLDSLDTVEVVMAFEEEFAVEIPDSEADKILSTSDAINYIAAHPQAK